MRTNTCSVVISGIVLLAGGIVTAEETGAGTEIWDLGTVPVGASYQTTVSAANASCAGEHDFEISIEDAPWLRLMGPARLEKIAPGQTKLTAAAVDLRDVAPGAYVGTVHIRCVTCPPPPACVQTATELEVRLVAVGSGPSTETTPPPVAPGDEPTSRSSPEGPAVAPGPDDPESEISDEECALSARKTQVYSRGQNNPDQMKQQVERSGTATLQYETARMKLEWSMESACECRDRADGDPPGRGRRVCSGTIGVELAFWITKLDPKFKRQVIGYEENNRMKKARAVVPVEPPPADDRTRETSHDGQSPVDPNSGEPRPSVRMHAERKYQLPQGRNPFEPEGEGYVARSSTTIPCSAGEHAVRFLMVDNEVLDRDIESRRKHEIDDDLQIIADANITIGQSECELELEEMESFLVELRRKHEFSPVQYTNQKGQLGEADPTDELPRSELIVGRRTYRTHSLLKLIESNGRKIDDPHPQRQQGVRKEPK